MEYGKRTKPWHGVLTVIVLGLATQALCDLIAHWIWGDDKQLTDTMGFFSICLLIGVWAYGHMMANEVNGHIRHIVPLVSGASRKSPHTSWETAIQEYVDQKLTEHAEMIKEHEHRLLVLDQDGLTGIRHKFPISPYDPTNPKELAETRSRVRSWIKRELRDSKKRFYTKYDFYKSYSGPLRIQKLQPRDWKAHLPSEEPVKQTA